MKKLLLLLSLAVVTLSAALSSLIVSNPLGGTALADNVGDAKAYCLTAEDTNTDSALYQSCYNGYLQAKKVQAGKANDTKDHYCKTTPAIDYSACAGGWDAALKGTQPGSDDSEEDGQISEACSSYKGDDYDSCAQGYRGAKANKSQADSCKGAKSQTPCKNAWTNAGNRLDPSQVTQGAAENCKDSKSNHDEYNACVIAYQEGFNGGSENVCDNYEGEVKTLCVSSFDKGKSDAAGADEQLDCDMKYDNPLTWIMCPLIDTLAGIIDGLDHIITKTMEVDTDSIFNDDSETSRAYHDVWQQFRNIALGLMIIAGLVIVISQALGMEILDAYTIRKTLPRLLIAAIFISLSWPLMHFLIDASNWLGFGIRRLIYYPFTQGGLKSTIDLSFGGGIWNILGGSLATVGGAGLAIPIWIALGGVGVTLSYAATGALAVGIAILVLVLREIAVIFLMLIAPMAIIMYALPNTQKFYKFWWESFSKALLMFPLIAAFIAVGRVFAAVSFASGGPINQLIGFISYFAPYFLIPLTFKFAGGFVRQLGGFVNDRGRGAFDGLRKYRGGQRQKRVNAARTGGLYRPEYGEFYNPITGRKSSVGKMANAMGNALDLDEVTPYWLGRAGVPGFRRTPQIVDEALADQAVEHSSNLAKKLNWNYETAWGVLGNRGTRNEETGKWERGLGWSDATEQKLRQAGFYERNEDEHGNVTWGAWQGPQGDVGARRLAEILQEDDASDKARRAGAQLMSSAAKLGTYKGDDETRRADIETAALFTAASQGRAEADLMATTHSSMRNGDGFYPGFNENFATKRLKAAQDMASQQRVEMRDGKLFEMGLDGEVYSVFDTSHWQTVNGELVPSAGAIDNVKSMKGQALMSSKAETIQDVGHVVSYLAGAGKGADQLSAEELSWRQQVASGFVNSYDDAGSREAWLGIARQVGMDENELIRMGRNQNDAFTNDMLNQKGDTPKTPEGGK